MIIDGILVENEWTDEFSYKSKEIVRCDWKPCDMTGRVHINQATAVPHVTDLSGTSRGALPPPARGTAFELLLAVMFVSKPSDHLTDKHMDVKH